ncbi:hypothetical protein CDL12_24710 [Handroanthus impetiginosus]|uniref:Zinc finger CHCC-type domain-containing protein n=1 Tax=Handroanthus impetiginosus TaxID=429701 RepID=A0A2G9GBW0_9LAMI|nr:hypothetical protein CDL12_24710 [Handroanthus impetiginosus]
MATQLMKNLTGSSNSRSLSGNIGSEDTSKKSPMELINEVSTSQNNNLALGHPVEFICLDKEEPAVCKYFRLRYVQDHHH